MARLKWWTRALRHTSIAFMEKDQRRGYHGCIGDEYRYNTYHIPDFYRHYPIPSSVWMITTSVDLLWRFNTLNSTLDQPLRERNVTLRVLKEHLRVAQEKMKKSADNGACGVFRWEIWYFWRLTRHCGNRGTKNCLLNFLGHIGCWKELDQWHINRNYLHQLLYIQHFMSHSWRESWKHLEVQQMVPCRKLMSGWPNRRRFMDTGKIYDGSVGSTD